MNIFIWLWLGAIVLFGVAEILTEGMVCIWRRWPPAWPAGPWEG